MDFRTMKTHMLPATFPIQMRSLLLGVALFLSGAGVCYGVLTWGTRDAEAQADPVGKPAASAEEPSVVHFDKSKWAAAGIKIEPAIRAPIKERIWRTGKVALNQDLLAHIYPLVEGIV